jgi:GTP cyclohydrolase I
MKDSQQLEILAGLISQTIPLIDSDSSREGLRDTPSRHAKFLKEFLVDSEPFNVTTFDSEGYDEMIVQTGIPFYSMCEHHMVPFFGHATIAYIPNEQIVGLSKLARTLVHFSRNLQNQERITKQVTEFLNDTLHPRGVGVTLTARHLCMEMRGIEKPGTQTTTTFVKGVFKDDPATRSEFLAYIKK